MKRVLPLPLLLSATAIIRPPAAAQGDAATLADPTRPVCSLGRTTAALQWYTVAPAETRVQMRLGDVPCKTWRATGVHPDPWSAAGVRIVEGPAGKRTYHRTAIAGLKPGTRYSYRVYDPGAEPTGLEQRWGAQKPWRREFSFSTLAPKGRMTIMRVPVKVLLMPNVVNVASAHGPGGQLVPPPPALTAGQLAQVRDEYATSARFLFINSGMRVWYDYRIVVDDRWQRWGEEPANVSAAYKGWPVCRSYAGQDFVGPGGGDFTFVDAQHPARVVKEPIAESEPYPGQIEQAFTRRWDPAARAWVFYGSGGGTLGLDDWDRGIPGRSQYLGGSDTAWLATHEFHHQIESLGRFSLANREDDRVIFDHFFPRRREKKADGTWDEWTWQTSWKHGEHWDGIAYFDRMLTPVQWLRMHFGETITVVDADSDGVPDDDPRLPFDEKRFGSDARTPRTDGAMGDLAKAQLSTWAPHPLTTSWNKAPQPRVMPNPRKPDSDGDGLPDAIDPYPLYPWQPFIWPVTASVDGDAAEWRDVPLAGEVTAHGVHVQWQQAHDDNAYYACFRMKGPWRRVYVGLDPEGQGYYSTSSTYAFNIEAGAPGTAPTLHAVSGNKCAGLVWKAGVTAGGEAVLELSVPNRGESLWFWQDGGREVGASISITTRDGKPLSIYEPYNLFYCRMLEMSGRKTLPPGAPAPLADGPGVLSIDFAKGSAPPDAEVVTGNWAVEDGALRFVRGGEADGYFLFPGFAAKEFDFWAEVEAANDMHMAAYTADARQMDNVTDYVAFIGGFGNARSVIRAFGQEAGSEDVGMAPGRHTMQLSRRAGQLWLLYDGKPIAYGADPSPEKVVTRLGFLGGWDGKQIIHRVRIRAARP